MSDVADTEDHDEDDDEARVYSVLSGTARRNRWRVAAETAILTIFGRTFLDLRQAEATADELYMSVWCVFGSVTILVPEGCHVRPSGMAFFASSDSLVPEIDEPTDFPPLEIEANVVFGRVRVRTALGEQAPEPTPLDQPVRRGAARAAPVGVDVDELGAAPASGDGPIPARPVEAASDLAPVETPVAATEPAEQQASAGSRLASAEAPLVISRKGDSSPTPAEAHAETPERRPLPSSLLERFAGGAVDEPSAPVEPAPAVADGDPAGEAPSADTDPDAVGDHVAAAEGADEPVAADAVA